MQACMHRNKIKKDTINDLNGNNVHNSHYGNTCTLLVSIIMQNQQTYCLLKWKIEISLINHSPILWHILYPVHKIVRLLLKIRVIFLSVWSKIETNDPFNIDRLVAIHTTSIHITFVSIQRIKIHLCLLLFSKSFHT